MIVEPQITIAEALAAGRRQTLWPRILLLIGTFLWIEPLTILCLLIANYGERSGNMTLIVGGITIVAFFVLIYLPYRYWRKQLMKWKLWAYSQVADVHELSRNAKISGLDFEDTMLAGLFKGSAADQAQWATIKARFEKPGSFSDDLAIPAETVIGISRSHVIFTWCMQLLMMAPGVAIVVLVPKPVSPFLYLIAAILIVGMLYSIITYTRDILIRRPRLIISNQGIQTPGAGFHPWQEIRNERIVVRLLARGVRTEFLCYDHPHGSEDLKLTPYAISRRRMERLLYVYRHRNQ